MRPRRRSRRQASPLATRPRLDASLIADWTVLNMCSVQLQLLMSVKGGQMTQEQAVAKAREQSKEEVGCLKRGLVRHLTLASRAADSQAYCARARRLAGRVRRHHVPAVWGALAAAALRPAPHDYLPKCRRPAPWSGLIRRTRCKMPWQPHPTCSRTARSWTSTVLRSAPWPSWRMTRR